MYLEYPIVTRLPMSCHMDMEVARLHEGSMELRSNGIMANALYFETVFLFSYFLNIGSWLKLLEFVPYPSYLF